MMGIVRQFGNLLVNDMVSELIGAENLLELECTTSRVLPLDDPDAIDEMQAEADAYYSLRHYDIMKFLGLTPKK